MNAKQPPDPTSLSHTATAFEESLARYEKIASELRRTPVRSEKTLARTKRLLNESAECEQEIEQRLRAMLRAMQVAREAQQATMQHTLESAQAVQRRAEELATLLERVAKLGERARDVSGPVANVMAQKAAGVSATELASALDQVIEHMLAVVQDADSVLESAEQGDWPDVAKDVKTLKQQMEHARAKVISARGDLAKSIDATSSAH